MPMRSTPAVGFTPRDIAFREQRPRTTSVGLLRTTSVCSGRGRFIAAAQVRYHGASRAAPLRRGSVELHQIKRGKDTVDRVAWLAFFALMPPLWVSGVWLFARSGLTRRRKILWALFLLGVGAAVGWFLPLASIRNRFLVLLALLQRSLSSTSSSQSQTVPSYSGFGPAPLRSARCSRLLRSPGWHSRYRDTH